MFDRFTDRARKCMGHARLAALSSQHDYIGSEHILLGLLETDGVGMAILKNLEMDQKQIGEAVRELVAPGASEVTMGQLPFTSSAKNVLEFSLEEAVNLGHTYIGSEHLLLGMMREQEGTAGNVLRGLGAQVEAVREGIVELLGAEPSEPSSGISLKSFSAMLRGNVGSHERSQKGEYSLDKKSAKSLSERVQALEEVVEFLCGEIVKMQEQLDGLSGEE